MQFFISQSFINLRFSVIFVLSTYVYIGMLYVVCIISHRNNKKMLCIDEEYNTPIKTKRFLRAEPVGKELKTERTRTEK